MAVTIEFLGPLLLAAVGSRRPRDLVWVGLAALGITLFGAGPTKVDAVGFGLALLAGGCWALYIVSTGERSLVGSYAARMTDSLGDGLRCITAGMCPVVGL